MKIGRLFRVLVIGGATLGAGFACADDAVQKPKPDGVVAAVRDSAVVTDKGATSDRGATRDTATAAADATKPIDCGFCPNTTCCDSGKLKKGFVCCWGTTC